MSEEITVAARRLLGEAEHVHAERWPCGAERAELAARIAVGLAVLGQGQELAGIRAEVAGLTAAVRELTAAVASAGEQVAGEIGCLPETTGDVGVIATALESLAAEVAEARRPRRAWWGRRRDVRPEVAS